MGCTHREYITPFQGCVLIIYLTPKLEFHIIWRFQWNAALFDHGVITRLPYTTSPLYCNIVNTVVLLIVRLLHAAGADND